MSEWFIYSHGLVGNVLTESAGDVGYLKSYDPEAGDGRGAAVFTDLISEAMSFPSADAGWELWRSSPASRPLRPDGRPNRPLTAFTIEIQRR